MPAPQSPAADRLAPADRSGPHVVPIVVAVACWSIAGVSVLLVPFTEPQWHPGQWYFLVDLADAVVFGGVAAALLARGRHPVAWLTAACGLGGAIAALGFQWSAVLAVHPELPRLDPLSSTQNWAWVPGTLAMILVVPHLVRRRPLGTVGRWACSLSTILVASFLVTRWTDPYPWPDGPTMAPFPVRSTWWLSVLDDAFRLQMYALCALATVAVGDLVRRWRRLDPEARRGLGWLAVGAGLMSAAFLPLAMPQAWTETWPVWLTPVLHLGSQLFFPAALLVAVLGQQLRGLDVAVGRATVYGLLTAGVVTVYLGVAWTLDNLLDGRLPGLVGAALVALGIQPARVRIQRRVVRLVHGDAADPARAIAIVGEQLGAAADEGELSEVVAESLCSSLRLGGVGIDVDWPGGARRLAQSGLVGTDAITLPLVVHREHVGDLVVQARRGERLDRGTLDALERLAPIVAATVQLVARTRALTESRARIAVARDEERRRLRRELHDGFGPALAGIGLGLEAVRNLRGVDDVAAGELLERLSAEVEARVEDVRTLARGLLPPILEELGLVPALVELTDRHRRTDGLAVSMHVDDPIPPVDAEQQIALYGIVAEAVRNVVRHAGATSCEVAVRRLPTGVVVTVRDDGSGIADDHVPGVGLRSMAERAESAGASLSIRTGSAGTTVEVVVPSRPVALAVDPDAVAR